MTKAERAASEARRKREDEAHDAGLAFFKKNPDLMLVEVHRCANRLYSEHYEPSSFVEGYQLGRKQRDDYLAELRTATPSEVTP